MPITLTGQGTIDSNSNTILWPASSAVRADGYQDTGGSGSLILGVANTYTGGTIITSGSLQIGDRRPGKRHRHDQRRYA